MQRLLVRPTSRLLRPRRAQQPLLGVRRFMYRRHIASDPDLDPASLMGIAAVGVAVCGVIYYYDTKEANEFQMIRITDASQCHKKSHADRAPRSVPHSSLQRVPQSKRLPLSVLEANGVRHASLAGVTWIEEDETRYYEQPYWNDEAAYTMTSTDAQALRNATYELHAMCLQAVDRIVASDALLDVFEIPFNLRQAVRDSWARRDPDLLGRFDFSWDGTGPPKLLEYNADTPTVLVETAVGQRLWQSHVLADSKQWCFNEIEDRLKAAWTKVVPKGAHVHLAGTNATIEEIEHVAFMHRMALIAGLNADVVPISSVSVDGDGHIVDGTKARIEHLWKLYPYEWLASESLGDDLFVDTPGGNKRLLEPAWKLLLGNKALLALLWEMFPDHPNLLPATYDRDDILDNKIPGNIVAKPKYGREGAGILYSGRYKSKAEFLDAADKASMLPTEGHDGVVDLDMGAPVYQAYHATSSFALRKIVLGSWVVHGAPAGFCVREDIGATTNDNSCFVPHCIDGPRLSKSTLPELSPAQNALLHSLYKDDADAVRKESWGTYFGTPFFRSPTSASTGATAARPPTPTTHDNAKAQAYAAKRGRSTRYPRSGTSGGFSRATGAQGMRGGARASS
ncbi:hypothetical protein SDRG_06953 [Saprolegnia diclina VS20]|uniref:Glutathionylspermidine synthase pre-ATP-grasp-like domain-containing protein n=1 Tax=Saprolegnia diclina (strain VS20) TaxID=1156394 RepID=T0QLR7_SAPDV|nr:hypothetical protein SDRG_06953 [Saprolegnia diclina VS20]EQC35671.1 hypothetical protein SDRG_06953 [Saprolegnia diclina VS20]|eukprot:XP_008610988.1 hypothetical protein SDRG_06953 [Saprolegnia diclina VS20]